MPQKSKVYGHISGVRFGAHFASRKELLEAGVHGQIRAGIHGDSSGGAFSICISGGYKDDEDFGDRITYAGSGGQDPKNGKQIINQTIRGSGNQALYVSSLTRLPVRVIRGRPYKNKSRTSRYAPSSGYRYDGLYTVVSFRVKQGKEGHDMYFFELRRVVEEGDGPIPTLPGY